MVRTGVALVGIVLVVGCTPRPDRRRADVIGAPAVGVASESDPDQSALTPERLRERALERALQDARQKLTVEGIVQKSGPGELTVAPEGGRPLVLTMVPLSSVAMDGRPLSPEGLPEGSQVRASYVAHEGENVAESVELVEIPTAVSEARRVVRPREGPMP